MMDVFKRSAVRFENGVDSVHLIGHEAGIPYDSRYNSFDSDRSYSMPNSVWRGSQGLSSIGRSLRYGVSRGFAEDYDGLKNNILNPHSNFVQQWNKVFLLSCLVALFVDPFFFFLPAISNAPCIQIQRPLAVVVTILRTITDAFYLFHMALQFRTAYVAPSSRVFGRGVLVVDPRLIAKRYLMRDFWMDLLAVLPLPQMVIWIVIPALKGTSADYTKNSLRFIIFFQYLPRLFLIFPLTSQIVKTVGVVTEKAWAGAAYNLVLYILASHVVGACWYLLAIERKDTCWRDWCKEENATGLPKCKLKYLYCGIVKESQQQTELQLWRNNTNITGKCSAEATDFFDFGIYKVAFSNKIDSAKFLDKYFYCLWWGLQNLSSLGQNLTTSTFVGEIVFAILIAIVGLVLFALLIGNMQTYLQSLGFRLEEWRVKHSDTEEWMRHRQLPLEMRERVRQYNQYKWATTQGVDEAVLFENLPRDLRRDIKRHLCLELVLQVPLFSQMDDRLLDAICERLRPVLCTDRTIVVQEGDPVNEMLFIIRGILDSVTTSGGQAGFFNSIRLDPGHFCGEELLTWALDPKPSVILPSSTRSVQALGEVEAFALSAEDLKFVSKQFRRLHSKKLQQTFRFHSHQWRMWAACFIQAAWKRYKRRKSLAELYQLESCSLQDDMSETIDDSNSSFGATIFSSGFAKNSITGVQKLREVNTIALEDPTPKVPKPMETEFNVDGEDVQEQL